MATLERNVAPEETQSQWVGEAAIRGKTQVSAPQIGVTDGVDDTACIVDDLSCWITVHL